MRFYIPALILLMVAFFHDNYPQVIFFLFGIPVLFFVSQHPITIHKEVDGLFWLTGFCPEYVAECKRDLDAD